MTLYKTYNVCINQSVFDNLPPNATNFQNVPSFVAIVPFFGTLGLVILANQVGSYSFTFTIEQEPFEIQINVTQCIEDFYDNCCTFDCNIAWLNRQGGWQNYIFTGIRTYEIEQESGSTFKTIDKVKKWAEKTEVFEAVICTTGNVPRSHIDYIDSLRYSIQAYLFNEQTQKFDIDILLDSESYTKYTSRQKFFDVAIRFLKTKEIIIQSQ